MSDPLGLAIDRAAGARPIAGNTLEHHPDSAVALAAMLADIAAARRWVHLENYIIRDDHTGRRFADVLAERAAAKVRVRVLYAALGSIGTSRRFWRRLRQAGAEVRAFHPLLSLRQLEWLNWIDRGRGRRGRGSRIDDMIRRLLPSAAATEGEVAEPVGPPPDVGGCGDSTGAWLPVPPSRVPCVPGERCDC